MRNKKIKIQSSIITFCLVLFIGCNDIIEYSQYDINVSKRNLNLQNIETLNAQDDTVVFAVVSDTHSYYNDFTDAVAYINNMKDVDFAVVCGDITDAGLSTEFEWYHKISKKLKVPYFTIIGNHDYRSNGGRIFRKMFGSTNFYFDYAGYRFVCFDDVVWENDNALPDFNWLKEALSSGGSQISQPTILFAHIPHTSDQLVGEKGAQILQIISDSPVIMSIYGHDHTYHYEVTNNMEFLTLSSMNKREIVRVQMLDTRITFNKINF